MGNPTKWWTEAFVLCICPVHCPVMLGMARFTHTHCHKLECIREKIVTGFCSN